jgi:preprotein translocase subunit YajC
MVLFILFVLYMQNRRINKSNQELYDNLKKLDDADRL